MDPVTALGLASAVIQVIDFSTKLVSGTVEAYTSAPGTTVEFEDSARVIRSLRGFTGRLDLRTTNATLSPDEKKPSWT